MTQTRKIPAPALITLLYLSVGLAGTLLLSLPFSAKKPLSLTDALFTSFSALTVTGLTTVSTANDLTLFGQIVVLILIQVGGLGIVTISLFLVFLFGHKIADVTSRRAFSEMFSGGIVTDIRTTLKFVFIFTFSAEFVIFLLLLLFGFEGYENRFFLALFHAVSSFCHAGFDITGKSLVGLDTSTVVIHAVAIAVSSLGFPVLFELILRAKREVALLRGKREIMWRLSVHSRAVLWVSVGLWVTGALVIFLLSPLSLPKSLFTSITSRTAGFTVVDISSLSAPALLCIVVLMYIGSSPASTGGGIKTVTFAVLLSFLAKSTLGRRHTALFRRTIPERTVEKAVAFSVLATFTIFTSWILLLIFEGDRFSAVSVLFEVVSAFATVGLSTGITPHLSEPSKVLLVFNMFAGKVGLLNLIWSIRPQEIAKPMKFAEEDVFLP